MNIIKLVFQVLLLLGLPVVEANLKYGDAPKDASEEEKEALRQAKVADFNSHSDELVDEAVSRGVIPGWVGDVVKKVNDLIAASLVRLANYHRFFGHNGNPPSADQ